MRLIVLAVVLILSLAVAPLAVEAQPAAKVYVTLQSDQLRTGRSGTPTPASGIPGSASTASCA